MKLLYFANVRLPTEKAHGIQIMKMCEALAKAGTNVELVVTNRATPFADDPFDYYGVKTRFSLTRLPVVDTVRLGRLGFLIETRSFVRAANRLLKERAPDVIYGRDERVLARLKTQVPVLWETHTGAWNAAARKTATRARRVIAISQGLADFYAARGVPKEKIIVARDGVDVAQFDIAVTRVEARAALGISPTKPLVVYTGSQHAHKGVDTLRTAAIRLPGIELLVVSDKPHKDMPLYLRAADVVVLPNSATDAVSARYTSPMKLFEYLASGTPLVASDVPSLREVLDESLATLVAPDDSKALAEGIRRTLVDPQAPARAARARQKAMQHTWDTRARIILSAL